MSQIEYSKLPKAEQFAYLMHYAINLYFPANKELENVKIKRKDYPIIHGDIKLKREISDYVAKNVAEYINIHQIKVVTFDMYKIVYWVGMYFYEHGIFKDVSPIQKKMIKILKNDDKVILYTDMYNKINELSKRGAEEFFRYYGRFGLYHAFKLFQKNCN